jgi:hypothetical protein
MQIQDFDDQTRGQVNARRNYLLGLWVGKQLGLRQDELSIYVEEVMLSDFEEPGPNDILRKVKADLEHAGFHVEHTELLDRFKTIERSVRAEVLSTD